MTKTEILILMGFFRYGAKLLVMSSKLLGVTLTVEKDPDLDLKESFIVVMNHQSALDLIGKKIIF